SGCRRPGPDAHKLAEIGLSALGQDRFTGRVAQFEHGFEICSGRPDGCGEAHADWRPAGKPLVAAKHRACPANGAGNHWHASLTGNLEGAEIEARESGATRERSFRKKHQDAALTG